ncbi:hypothetical protein IWW45_009243, partial [Coemansia sp. RSA 485]
MCYQKLRALTAHSSSPRGQPNVMQFDAVLIIAGLLVFAAPLAALVAVIVALGHKTPDQIVARAWRTRV